MSKLEKVEKAIEKGKEAALIKLAQDKDEEVRLAAIAGMGKIGKDDSFNFIVPDMLTNDDPKVRATAAEALGNMDNEHASAHLRYYLEREKDPTALRVSREEPVFQKIGLKAKVDLFVGYIDRVTIYEAKAGKTKALDLYQLRMYVDGCALDNKPVDEAVLIAKRHSAEVKELRDILNSLTSLQFPVDHLDEEGIVIRQSA